MKKIILALSLSLMLFAIPSVNAQRATKISLTAGDTVVNTGSSTKVINATGGYGASTIQVISTKLSGTVAGNIVLSGSLDGTNYVATDSVACSNVPTNVAIFAKPVTNYSYYKVTHTGVGTMAAVLTVWYLFRNFSSGK